MGIDKLNVCISEKVRRR